MILDGIVGRRARVALEEANGEVIDEDFSEGLEDSGRPRLAGV